ncbi:DUF2020 domain-containing protein [Corynebacterium fournieri]|uniref:DUF2020 domain-containing protein n=1 Tax=Corynebacterium fournieri TaxID=1852390 RepID=UPI000A2F4A4C|nr:DUF2020 domain-containing protein [Corynebacterium fournieri]WJY98517.1 hypothetical protein CFOUR_10670 [Corynebacterium fournieri]
MRLRVPTALLLLALAGCSQEPLPSDDPSATPSPEPALPVQALPETPRDGWTECPYLDTEWVAQTNGQRVTGVGTDTRFDPPACQYWSYPEEPQLTVMVRHMDSVESARAVVDYVTPVANTQPASLPGGWEGGRHGGGDVPGRIGAAFAVAKGTTAVAVFTNQNESVKAESVAEKVIANLAL